MKKHVNLENFMTWIYRAFSLTLLWYLGLALGLGLFGLLPSCLTTFKLMDQLKNPRFRDRMKIWPAWKQAFFPALKSYWWVSGLWFLVLWILMTNLIISSGQACLVASMVYYWTLFLLFFWTWVLITFAYASAGHPDMALRELFKNTLLIPAGHLVEMVILTAFTALVILVIMQTRSGLLIFLGPYVLFRLWHWIFDQILQGKSIRSLWSDWRRME